MEDFLNKMEQFQTAAREAFLKGNSEPMDATITCSKEWAECVESFHRTFDTKQSDALCLYFMQAIGS